MMAKIEDNALLDIIRDISKLQNEVNTSKAELIMLKNDLFKIEHIKTIVSSIENDVEELESRQKELEDSNRGNAMFMDKLKEALVDLKQTHTKLSDSLANQYTPLINSLDIKNHQRDIQISSLEKQVISITEANKEIRNTLNDIAWVSNIKKQILGLGIIGTITILTMFGKFYSQWHILVEDDKRFNKIIAEQQDAINQIEKYLSLQPKHKKLPDEKK